MVNFSVSRLEGAAKSNKEHQWQNMNETPKKIPLLEQQAV